MHNKTARNTHLVVQIEALLKRINDENKKTKEVLEKIDRGEFKKEKRVSDQCGQMFFFFLIPSSTQGWGSSSIPGQEEGGSRGGG